MSSTSANASGATVPDLKPLVSILGDVHRLRMICHLSCGEPREIGELAGVAGCSYMAAMRHVTKLYRAGILQRGRGRLYQLAPQYLPTANQPLLDFGFCLIRPTLSK